MARQIDQVSALDGRIRQGKADPISPAEKLLVAGLREGFEKKFGRSKVVTRSSKTGRVGSATVSGKTVASKVLTGRSAARAFKSK